MDSTSFTVQSPKEALNKEIEDALASVNYLFDCDEGQAQILNALREVIYNRTSL